MINKFGRLKIKAESNVSQCDLCGWNTYFNAKVYLDDKIILEESGDNHTGGGPTSVEDLYPILIELLFDFDIEHQQNEDYPSPCEYE